MSEQFVRNMMDGCGRLKAFRMLAFLTRVLASLSGIYRDHEDWVNCSLLGKYGGHWGPSQLAKEEMGHQDKTNHWVTSLGCI